MRPFKDWIIRKLKNMCDDYGISTVKVLKYTHPDFIIKPLCEYSGIDYYESRDDVYKILKDLLEEVQLESVWKYV